MKQFNQKECDIHNLMVLREWVKDKKVNIADYYVGHLTSAIESMRRESVLEKIIFQIGRILSKLDIEIHLKSIINSFGDTLEDKEILSELESISQHNTLCKMGFDENCSIEMCIYDCENCEERRKIKVG